MAALHVFLEKFYDYPHQHRRLCHQHRRYTVAELRVLRLVVPHAHPQPRPAAAAKGRHPQQNALGNPPPCPLRLPLVNAVQEKRDHIDGDEVEDEEGGDVTHDLYFSPK